MKLFLIKIGKAVSVLKREGLLRGGRRVVAGFLALFRRVPAGDILFVAGGVGDSARYRTAHVAEELQFKGFKTSITVQDNPFLPGYADKFSVFIFHRVLFTPLVATLIENIKKQGKEIIFDTDDLVYDPQYLAHMDYFQEMNRLERKLYENGVGGEILADPYVKVCTTTTSFLADKLSERPARNASAVADAGGRKQVFVVSNKLSKHDLEVGEALYRERISNFQFPISNKKDVLVGYFSGTLSHNKDFATITEPLIRLFEKYPQMKLVIVGPLDIPPELEPYRSRIMASPYMPRNKYFANMAKVDICIAPLEISNPFCESKSELKWFEPGMLGIPSVVAGTRPFREAVTDGVDGFVASTNEEWFAQLERLIVDPELRQSMGEKAREKVLRDYTTVNATNKEYYEYLNQK